MKKTVLFLCIANTARSQMAEGFFNHLYRGRARAVSGGVKAGGGPHPFAVQAMAEAGVDISRQASKTFTEAMLRSADRVVKVCSEFDRACPVLPVPAVHWDVENPHGKPIEVFQRVRDDVQRRVGMMEKEFPELFRQVRARPASTVSPAPRRRTPPRPGSPATPPKPRSRPQS